TCAKASLGFTALATRSRSCAVCTSSWSKRNRPGGHSMSRSSRRTGSEPVPDLTEVQVSGASWLSDSALLLVGTQLHDSAVITQGWSHCDAVSAPFVVGSIVYSPRNGQSSLQPARWAAVALADARLRGRTDFGLTLSDGVGTWELPPASISRVLTDLRSLVRVQFTALDARERALIVELLVSSSKDLGGDEANRLRLSRSSNLVRDMLRERLPVCDLRPNRIEGLAVE